MSTESANAYLHRAKEATTEEEKIANITQSLDLLIQAVRRLEQHARNPSDKLY